MPAKPSAAMTANHSSITGPKALPIWPCRSAGRRTGRQDRDRHETTCGLRPVGDDVDAFQRAQHRDGGRDHAVAIDQRRAEQAHGGEDGRAVGPVRADQRHQRQDAALAVIVGAHDEQAVFDRDGDDQRPEDQRQAAERALREKCPPVAPTTVCSV